MWTINVNMLMIDVSDIKVEMLQYPGALEE